MAAWRVGLIGAGPGVSALHLPTLARLTRTFTVARIADGGSGRARRLAARCGATASTGVDEMLGHGDLDAVLVASPPDHHAHHVEAACRAGVRGILVEKPFAALPGEAEHAARSCQRHGVALVVGTNHLYDPGWQQAWQVLEPVREDIRRVTVSMALPPNARYHRVVTESSEGALQTSRRLPDWTDHDMAASVVRQLVLGLANHDLPAVRRLLPDIERVDYAGPTPPIGHVVGFRASGALVQLLAVMQPQGPDAHWRMSVATSGCEVEIAYPPAFVHAGSATVTIRDGAGAERRLPRHTTNGYVREWEELDAQLAGRAASDVDGVLADTHYALAVADGAAQAIRGTA